MDKKTVTQRFGNKSKVERYSGGVNRGTDFGVPKGTPIAVPEGRWQIVEAFDKATKEGPNNRQRGVNKGYGNSVVVQNLDTKEKLRFSHLSKVLAKGGTVEGGTVVGLSGATGNVAGKTGQHLDLEYFDSKGRLRDVMASRYANAPIIASAETNDQSVSGYYTTNTGSTDKNMDTGIAKMQSDLRTYLKGKGWADKKIEKAIDFASEQYEIKTGVKKADDITDPSERVLARETQKGLSVEDLIPEKDRLKATEEEVSALMTAIDEKTVTDRESALKRINATRTLLEKKGVYMEELDKVLDTYYPKELEEEQKDKEDVQSIFRPGAVEKIKNIFRPVKKPSTDIFGALSGGA